MTEQQIKLLSNLKTALIQLSDAVIEEDNFNDLLSELNIFTSSIDDIISELNSVINREEGN